MISGYDDSQIGLSLIIMAVQQNRVVKRFTRKNMESEGFRVYEYEWWHFIIRLEKIWNWELNLT